MTSLELPTGSITCPACGREARLVRHRIAKPLTVFDTEQRLEATYACEKGKHETSTTTWLEPRRGGHFRPQPGTVPE